MTNREIQKNTGDTDKFNDWVLESFFVFSLTEVLEFMPRLHQVRNVPIFHSHPWNGIQTPESCVIKTIITGNDSILKKKA